MEQQEQPETLRVRIGWVKRFSGCLTAQRQRQPEIYPSLRDKMLRLPSTPAGETMPSSSKACIRLAARL